MDAWLHNNFIFSIKTPAVSVTLIVNIKLALSWCICLTFHLPFVSRSSIQATREEVLKRQATVGFYHIIPAVLL